MLVLRRALAVLLILLFPLVLFLALFALRVNATVLEPAFYTRALDGIDAYNFLYDEALPFAIRSYGPEMENGLPMGLELTPEGVAHRVRDVLPPEWLQENISAAIHQVVPYLTGRKDEFAVHVRVDDRAEAATDVLRSTLGEVRVYDFLIDDVVRPQLQENGEAFQELPLGLSLTVEQVLDGVEEIVPEEWLTRQVDHVLDETVPYLTARTDRFRAVIPLQDRADAGIAVLQGWFSESLEGGAYDYFIEEQIGPVVQQGLNGGVRLPYGVVITDEEILDTVATTLTPEWVEEHVHRAVDAIGHHLTGRSEALAVVIPIEDRTELAVQALVDLADSRLEEAYDSADRCTSEQMRQFNSTPREFPECRIPGYSYQRLKEESGFDVLDQIGPAMAERMPGSIELDDRALLGGFGESEIETVRRVLSEGFVFDDGALRNMAQDQGGPELAALLDDVREIMLEGIRFTDEDFRGQDGAQEIEAVRGAIGTARSLLFLVVLLPLGLVAAVGFLGGRSWDSRLIWAGAPLVTGGVLIALVSAITGNQIHGISDEAIRNLDADEVITAKLLELRDLLARSFVTPITIQSAVAAALGMAGVGGGVFLKRRWYGRKHDVSSPVPPDGRAAPPPEAVSAGWTEIASGGRSEV